MIGMTVMSVMMFCVFVVITSSMSVISMGFRIGDGMGVHLHCCRILGSSSRFVGFDMSSESVFVGNVIYMSVDSMSVFISVTSLDFVRRVTLFMAILSVSMSVMDVVPESIRLIMSMMLMMVIVVMMVMVIGSDCDDYAKDHERLHDCSSCCYDDDDKI
jgi:hypothetical protein